MQKTPFPECFLFSDKRDSFPNSALFGVSQQLSPSLPLPVVVAMTDRPFFAPHHVSESLDRSGRNSFHTLIRPEGASFFGCALFLCSDVPISGERATCGKCTFRCARGRWEGSADEGLTTYMEVQLHLTPEIEVLCCLRDDTLKIERYLKQHIRCTLISGVKYSWTTLYI